MHRWKLTHKDDRLNLACTDFINNITHEYQADGGMSIPDAIKSITDEARFGDFICLPDGTVLLYAQQEGKA